VSRSDQAIAWHGRDELAEPLPQPRLPYVVGRLERAVRRHLAEALRPHGLTIPQYTTLSVLRARRGLSNAQLARRAFITPQAMNEVMAALEEEGLVRREADPDHGRILRAELTEAGVGRLAACDAAVQAIEELMLTELPAHDRERLLADLSSCVRMLGGGLGGSRSEVEPDEVDRVV
jgi:DNA-binding MarR family transcriptional regulator